MTKKNKLVLVIEDNLENQRVIGSLLRENGYDVGISSSGEKALEFLDNEHPDLILLDVMMPEMDGFEVCRLIKKDLSLKHIPVIFLTAKTNTKDIVRGFEVGGVDYVSKPFSSEELLARIRTHIELKILRGFIPICSSCKKIRDDQGYWQSIEQYIQENSDVVLSHSLCPTCSDKLYGDQKWYKKKGR